MHSFRPCKKKKKTPVKFQKDRQKSVGRVAHTRYLLLEMWGGGTEPRKADCYVPSLFVQKGGEQQISCVMTGIRKLDKHHSQKPLELSYLQGQHAEPKASFQPCKRVLG